MIVVCIVSFLSRLTFLIQLVRLSPAEFQPFFSSLRRSATVTVILPTPKPGAPIQVSVRSEDMATAVDQKLLRQTKFPPEFSQKVDMKKVNIEVMKK